MAGYATTIRLAGYALGVVGGLLMFLEFFQLPSYVRYEPEYESYTVDLSPDEVREHTWAGRIGALALALAFVLLFVATFLG